jgi:nucleotide-binding universal stress UspA family protein
MFNNVLVGVDSEQLGRDPIVLASKLRARGGSLTLAHVVSGGIRSHIGPADEYELGARKRIQEMLEQAGKDAGVEADLRWWESDSAGRGLHEMCESMGADLLVIGSSRQGATGQVLIGDDSHAAINGVPCAVAIAPVGYAAGAGEIATVGVAYDGSPESEHALELARTVASERDAKLAALEVVTLPHYLFLGGRASDDATVEQQLDEARTRLGALDGVESSAVSGEPADELASWSASLDLLVCGSRGYGPLHRLVHGSTSNQLLHKAQCPLLVLNRRAAAHSTTEPAGTHAG